MVFKTFNLIFPIVNNFSQNYYVFPHKKPGMPVVRYADKETERIQGRRI